MKENIGYIFVEDESTYNYMYDAMFMDASKMSNFCTIVECPFDSCLESMIRKRKVQRFAGAALNVYYSKRYKLEEKLKEVTLQFQKIVVLFTNSSFLRSKYPLSVLQGYKKKYNNIQYVLLYVDIVNHPVSEYANYLRTKGVFDYVYSVDQRDAAEYGFEYSLTPYSRDERFNNIECDKNIYFCGVTKGRQEQIALVIEQCHRHDLRISMDIIYAENEVSSALEYNDCDIRVRSGGDFLKYPEVLSNTLSAECILEIVQKNQVALTLRAYEAVCYNRKLLTNNRAIFDFPFYNSEFMQYFEKVEEIDWDWVKEDVKVDYNYKGEFSPRFVLDDIKYRLNKK